MQFLKTFRIGQRAAKTALSVGLALMIAQILGSQLPIFAAIGAISVMSRTWNDSVQECLTQLAGTIIGYLVACVFVTCLPWRPQFFLWMAIGTMCVISICIALRLYFAIPLACIVFADVCLFTGGNAVAYGFHRLTDTIIGLGVALVVNIVIRPYNNRAKIMKMMLQIQNRILPLLKTRVLERRYPDLAPLRNEMSALSAEISIFEHQPTFALQKRAVKVSARRQESAYLRGCEQLIEKMFGELAALCNMDANPVPGEHSMRRLAKYHLQPAENDAYYGCANKTEAMVADFHIGNLLDAYDFLTAFHQFDS